MARTGKLMSVTGPKLPMWYRVFEVIVGTLSIAVALIVLVDPLLALWILILLLALGLLFVGVDRLVAGITGHPVGHGFPVLAVQEAPGPGSPPGSSPPKP